MIWVLVGKNRYRYEYQFGSFYRDPKILETVSIASQWVHTDLIEKLFLLKYKDKEYFQHGCVFVKVKCKNQM